MSRDRLPWVPAAGVAPSPPLLEVPPLPPVRPAAVPASGLALSPPFGGLTEFPIDRPGNFGDVSKEQAAAFALASSARSQAQRIPLTAHYVSSFGGRRARVRLKR